jgi:hypothetical protein
MVWFCDREGGVRNCNAGIPVSANRWLAGRAPSVLEDCDPRHGVCSALGVPDAGGWVCEPAHVYFRAVVHGPGLLSDSRASGSLTDFTWGTD